MRLNKPLNEILGNQIRVEILRTLFKYPGEFTGRHIARLADLPQASVQRQLKVLVDNKILNGRRIGASKSFSLNTKSFFYPTLKRLFNVESKLFSTLQELIDKAINNSPHLRDNLIHASVYGSVVRGEETPQSDIDLFLLFKGAFDKRQIQQAFESVDQQIVTISGMQLHPYAVSISEFGNVNKKLIEEVRDNSRTIYGRDLRDLNLIEIDKAKQW
jgi:predicted nucleotidyltransferase